jgi:ankyrin repeat protein
MPNTSSSGILARLAALRYFIPAALAFGASAFITQPAVLALLLAADALTLAAVCQVIGFGLEASFARTLLRRGLANFVLLLAYTAWLVTLVAYPMRWILHDATLPATLALSTALVLALLSLWRLWPAFGLVYVWGDAYPHQANESRILNAIRRSLRFAAHLTSEQDIFFSHGLPVALCLLLLCCGALSLAGLCGMLNSESRLLALLIYALLAPLLCGVIANRSVRALFNQAQLERRYRRAVRARATLDAGTARDEVLAQVVSPAELNATLLCAVRSGQVDLALGALERGADANMLPAPGERDQRSLLILAVACSDQRLLRALIAAGADINRMHNGLTPLLAATRDSHQGRPETVVMLLTNGANPRVADSEENTPLHHAALSAEPVVAALLLDSGAAIDALNRVGYTPLATACAMANWGLLRFLLERGARLDVEKAQPVLAVAAGIAEDDIEGIKLLLKRRAKVDAIGPLGRTALMNAALNGHAKIARVMLDAGASVQLVDSHGVSALMEAARAGAEAVIELLVPRKPDANLFDASGRSALMIACQSRQAGERTIRQLLALGADVQLQTPDGKRALDFALVNGRWDLVALLDPEHSLPRNMIAAASTGSLTDADSAAHLLDALRFGHWPVVELFSERARHWPSPQLAALYLELDAPEHAAARRWLLNLGMDANALTESGESLPQVLLARLPPSLAAVYDALDGGASLSGAGVLAQLLNTIAAEQSRAATPNFSAQVQTAMLEDFALQLIERGVDFCMPDAQGRSVLASAVDYGMQRLTRELLARGVDPNACDIHGRSALHAALHKPLPLALPLLQMLLRAGGNPEATAANNETPLGLALARAEPELTYWLRWSRWPLPQRALLAADLAAAAILGDIDAIKRLLALGFDVNACDAKGASALLRAAGSGHADLVEHLLAIGADANQAAPSGVTALAAAVNARRVAVVELLLTHGVAADQPLTGAGTPLMLAAAQAFPEIIERLLAHGAAINARDDKGRTALHAAAQFAFHNNDSERSQRTLGLLIGHGADIAQCNAEGQTALLLLLGAAVAPGPRPDQKHLLTLLPILLGNRAAIDLQDTRGVSALHACAMHGLLLPARTLLAARANTSVCDILGRTPAMLAQRLGYIDLVAELDSNPDAPPSAAQILRQRHET